MKIGTKVIITHDHTYHGIPLGKVAEVVKIPTPHLLCVAYNEHQSYVESMDCVEVESNPDLEAMLDERNYRRFWFGFKMSVVVLASIGMCLMGVVFFTIAEELSSYTAGAVCIFYGLFIAYAGKIEKRDFELNLKR